MTQLMVTKKWRVIFVAMMQFSLVWFLGVVAFRAALEATPADLTDSMGRAMGFNDVFSREHFGFVFERMSISRTLAYLTWYDGVWLAMLLLGLWNVTRLVSLRWMLVYSILQFLLFPFGILGAFGFLWMCYQIVKGFTPVFDRESFIDIPFVAFYGHAPWILCAVIFLCQCLLMMRKSERGTES